MGCLKFYACCAVVVIIFNVVAALKFQVKIPDLIFLKFGNLFFFVGKTNSSGVRFQNVEV